MRAIGMESTATSVLTTYCAIGRPDEPTPLEPRPATWSPPQVRRSERESGPVRTRGILAPSYIFLGLSEREKMLEVRQGTQAIVVRGPTHDTCQGPTVQC